MKDARSGARFGGRALPRCCGSAVCVVALLAIASCKGDKAKAGPSPTGDAASAREVDPTWVPYEALIELGGLAQAAIGEGCPDLEAALRGAGENVESSRSKLARTSDAGNIAGLLREMAQSLGPASLAVAESDTELARVHTELNALIADLREALQHAAASIENNQSAAAAAARTRIENAVHNLNLTLERLEDHCSDS